MVDGWLVGALGVAGVVTLLLLGVAVERGRTLEHLREATDGDPELASLPTLEQRIARLQQRAVDAAWEVARGRRDLATLADLIGVGILSLDDELTVRTANTAAHHFLGRSEGTLIGRPAGEALDEPGLMDLVRIAQGRGSAGGEVTVGGGRTLVVRARRSPISGLWVILEDVTELRRLQRIRTEFLGNLSHELRTPLSTISLLAETLARDAAAAGPAIPPKVHDRIAKIQLETEHLVQMVTEMLDLSRIESGAEPLLLDLVDLRDVARGAVERLRPFAERSGVQLAVSDTDGDAFLVRGDEDRLAQVVVNLLHNAIKFSPPGTTVTVRLEAHDGEVVTSVIDQGVGIPAADLPRIFERFYKVDRARVRGRGGTGLGLAIARHIVEGHGGRIWAASEEGRGSTFSFAIPAAARAESSVTPAAHTGEAGRLGAGVR
jgi:two-component system phosphate regulon sensor histidine kinase PhoR